MTGIIILTYETWEMTLRCIKSIKTSEKGLDYKVYLIDNASVAKLPEELRLLIEESDRYEYIKAESNRGYAAGNNLGITKALKDGCEYLVIANNDISFEKNAISEMIYSLKSDTSIGIAGPKVLNAKGEVQQSRCSMDTGKKELLQVFTILKKICKKKYNRYYCLDVNPEEAGEVFYVSGCCFAMSARCAREVTPFDEHTVLYNEEMILGKKMQSAGYKTWYEPQSTVVHVHGHTTKRLKPFMYQCISQSELYYAGEYLHAGKFFLWGLWMYRSVLYHIRCINSKEMRQYRKKYIEATKGALRGKRGDKSKA